MIDGVKITQLKQFSDPRGKVMHMFRCDDPDFQQFGEIYFSLVRPGAIKGWNRHTRITINLAVVAGTAKLVLYDSREESPSKGEIMEFCFGEENYVRVKIPPGIYTSFKSISPTDALVANCTTLPHDPNESDFLDPFSNEIPYRWNDEGK